MRDYTIAQLETEELREKQVEVVKALLDARPKDGYVLADQAARSTLCHYVAHHLSW